MVPNYNLRDLIPEQITPPDGVELVIGLYVIGDTKADTQLESGVFIKGKESSNFSIYKANIGKEEELHIDKLFELQMALLTQKNIWYAGALILIQQQGSRIAARFEAMYPEVIKPLEALIERCD